MNRIKHESMDQEAHAFLDRSRADFDGTTTEWCADMLSRVLLGLVATDSTTQETSCSYRTSLTVVRCAAPCMNAGTILEPLFALIVSSGETRRICDAVHLSARMYPTIWRYRHCFAAIAIRGEDGYLRQFALHVLVRAFTTKWSAHGCAKDECLCEFMDMWNPPAAPEAFATRFPMIMHVALEAGLFDLGARLLGYLTVYLKNPSRGVVSTTTHALNTVFAHPGTLDRRFGEAYGHFLQMHRRFRFGKKLLTPWFSRDPDVEA
jgi:hypothetical protein